MKYYFIVLSLCSYTILPAQKVKSNCPAIEALIKQRPYDERIEKEFFEKDVELTLSDSTYRIISFSTVWDEPNGDLVQCVQKGNIFKIVKPGVSLCVFRSRVGATITFENVRFLKGKDTCSAMGIAVYIIDKATADKEKINISCVARVAGIGRNPNVFPADIANGFTIELSDPSYTMVSFDMSTEDPETGDLLSARITSSHVSSANAQVSNILKNLRRGMIVTCDNISISKQGRIYKIRPLSLYIK